MFGTRKVGRPDSRFEHIGMAGNKACLTRLQKEYKQLLKVWAVSMHGSFEAFRFQIPDNVLSHQPRNL